MPSRGDTQRPLGREPLEPFRSAERSHRDGVTPGKEHEAHQYVTVAGRCKLQAPALARAGYADGLSGPQPLGRIGPQVDRTGPREGSPAVEYEQVVAQYVVAVQRQPRERGALSGAAGAHDSQR